MVELQPITIAMGLFSGICWTYVYFAIIYRGIKDKACGMPLWALCLNISWEFIFSFIFPSQQFFQEVINIVWFGADVLIVILYFRYEKTRVPLKLQGKTFYIQFCLALLTSFMLVLVFPIQFNRPDGGFPAFLQNVVMSVLFVYMFLERGTLGQSWKIGLAKLIGSFVFLIAVFAEEPSGILLIVSGFLSLLFDVIYVNLVYQASKRPAGEVAK